MTYLFVDMFRKSIGIVTDGDFATYPTVGGVQHCVCGSARLDSRRGARSFCTAKKEDHKHVFHYY